MHLRTLLALLFCFLMSHAHAQPNANEQGLGVVVVDRAILEANGRSIAVKLPDAWAQSGRVGQATYVLTLNLSEKPREAWAIYFPRIGNRFEVTVNGHQVGKIGRIGDLSTDSALRPHYFRVSDSLLRSGANQIHVFLEGERNRYAGLSRVHLGPDRLLRLDYDWRYNHQVGGAVALTIVYVVCSLLALVLSLSLRQASDLLFALATAFGAFRTWTTLVETPPFDYHWWAWAVDMSYAASMVCIYAFYVRAMGLNIRRWDMAGGIYLGVALVMVTWHSQAERSDIRSIWFTFCLAYGAFLLVVVVYQWWRHKTLTRTVLAVASVVAAGFGIVDYLRVFNNQDGYGGVPLLRFTAACFVVAMVFVVADRLITSLRQERALRISIDKEVEMLRLELASQYEQQAITHAVTARTQERQRIVQDLHDGMGLQLTGLLGLVEKDTLDLGEVQSEVRHTIEQLRTLVDGSETFDGTLAELLGHIRHRIETRLRRQSIALEWQVRGSAEWVDTAIDPIAALNLQHLMFELCTNVLKHSGARTVTVICEVGVRAGDLTRFHVCFEDDGRQPRGTIGRAYAGQRSIERRVRQLQGEIAVDHPGGEGWRNSLSFSFSNLVLKLAE